MPFTKSVAARTKDRESQGLLRLVHTPALNWILLAYAVVAVAAGWAYAASRSHADYEQTLEVARNRLRSVTAGLEAGTLAMLNDGVGAAVASANELQSAGGLIRASRAEIIKTLQKHLAGGDYVRFLFLTDGERFALAGRDGPSGSQSVPAWLTVSRVSGSTSTWVGPPIADPERPGDLVIPIAQRVAWGEGLTLWAGALFSFDGFDALYRKSGDQVAVIGLIAADGTILVRAPKIDRRDASAGASVGSTA